MVPVIQLPICAHQRVTQISVLEEFDLFLALVDNRMVMYDLNKLAQSHTNTGAQSPPRKLSKRGEIEYFSVGSMRNRVVLVYKRRAMGGQVLEVLFLLPLIISSGYIMPCDFTDFSLLHRCLSRW